MPFSVLLHLPWRVVVQAALFLVLVVGGTTLVVRLQFAEIEQVLRLVLHQTQVAVETTREVAQQTEVVETKVEEVVQENRSRVGGHSDLSKEHQQMYTHLVPLFTEITQLIEAALASHRLTHERMEDLLTGVEALRADCQAVWHPTPVPVQKGDTQ